MGKHKINVAAKKQFQTSKYNCNDPLNKYVNSISHYPVLNAEEEKKLAIRAKKGDESARQKLIESNLKFVVMVAKRYYNPQLSIMDIINEGNFGLIYAVDKFDYTKGVKFTSYAIWWIKWAILKAIYEQTSLIRIPMVKASEFIKLRRTIEENENNEEIFNSPHAKISFKEYKRIKNMFREYDSLDTVANYDNPQILKGDNLVDNKVKQFDKSVFDDELSRVIYSYIKKLPEIKQKIIIHRYGLFGKPKMTLEELAKEFGYTKERIRQIEYIVINKLRNRTLKKKLDIYFYN